MKRKIACYVRVSTVGQNEASQKATIQEWLKGQRISASQVVWYVDKETGDNMDRTGIIKLQQDVFKGKVSTIVVYKLDRLSRKMSDGIVTLSGWLDQGIRFVAVTQQFDFTGPVGKLIAAVLLGVAEMEQETRRERQAAGIKVAKQKGVYKGRARGSFKAQPDRARELRSNGFKIAEISNALGVSENTVHRYLRQS